VNIEFDFCVHRRALKIIEDSFYTICIEEQGIFEKNQNKNLEILPDDLKKKVKSVDGTGNRWNVIDAWVREKVSK